MRVYRDIYNAQGQFVRTDAVYDIMEATYTGKDMGDRRITATIKFPTPIDFKLGDYVVISMQTLRRDSNHGAVDTEKFYIYTEPQCKKTARKYSTGDAFETTVIFYPRQYELSCIQMRDFIQQEANSDKIIYTGFDSVTFYGGARELMDRCMACLQQQYHDAQGNPLWSYELADAVNEDKNNALERYTFSFQGNSVMDALMKLNDKDFINTTFFINGRKIYVGFKRPFLCSVNSHGSITDSPLRMMYGKTSHLPIDEDHGGLFDITKTVSDEVPITKLFAYGASRNLNRYYCSDRISSGRYVNKLMLPSFSDDGVTDWIESEEGIKKYGVREGSHNFEEIYPSLRYMTYADIRGVKYCIKIKGSGLTADQLVDGKYTHNNSISSYPVARVQCYKVTPCTGVSGDGTVGVNKLVECAPPEDLVIFIHATGKTVKVVLYGGETNAAALAKQLAHDPKVPTRDGSTDYIPGSCFCIHDVGFKDMDGTTHTAQERAEWFTTSFNRTTETDPIRSSDPDHQVAELHRIEYVDTFWLTDLYVMEYEGGINPRYDDQKYFKRDGYSAWAWPRLNNESTYPETLPVNEIVGVEPIVIADTSENATRGRQQHWDIYLRDIGFAIDEQNDFGEMVFVYSTPVVSMLDGVLAGREFTIDGGEALNDFQERVVCAYKEDGKQNPDFFLPGDSNNEGVPQQAFLNGAIWRIRLNRNDQDSELGSIGLVIPNVDIKAKAGDHMVLLDIYMPDIYIRAAENRLYREAKAFLEKNDKGNVKYAISFDKVRFNQISNYALQMREGVMLRMEDDDLNIKSENRIRDIVRYMIPNQTNVPFYQMVEHVYEDEPQTRTVSFYMDSDAETPKLREVATTEYDESIHLTKWTIKVAKDNLAKYFDGEAKSSDMDGIDIYCRNINSRSWSKINKENLSDFLLYDMGDYYSITFACDNYTTFGNVYELGSNALKIEIQELASWSEYEKEYLSQGDITPAICRDYVQFKAGKFYEILVDVKKHENSSQYGFKATGTHLKNGSYENNDQIFLTVAPTDIETRYKVPQYTQASMGASDDGLYRYKYSFYLPDEFDDDKGYYLALLYFVPTAGIDSAPIRLVSIVEKDLDAEGNTVDYVDFLASDVTIKIEDNTRPADTTGMGEDMRERVVPVSPEAIYDIQAQIEEQTKATTWETVRNDLEKTKIEADQNKKTQELIANAARQTYQSILNLRESIFDPDGTCNSTFLQVMMLQVGADSMNFQLDKTKQSVTGVPSNYSVGGRISGTTTYDKFKVFADDVLRHFVYTQGSGNAGTWTIPGAFEATLAPTTDTQGNTVWPTYYICIRCKKDTANDLSIPAWICSTKQYAVNDSENTDYWYFNWGILVADSSGNYSLTETRGNAYMYGDNLICGKISDIAKKSYFDLTQGNFVLSNGDESDAALSYINGVLTIKGLSDEDGIGKIIKDLGLEIENMEIGGENLYSGIDPLVLSGRKYTGIVLENGKKYVISIGDITGNALDLYVIEKDGNSYNDLCKIVDGRGGSSVTYKDIDVVVTGNGKELGFRCAANSGQSWTLSQIMVQHGNKPTTYNTYYKHLTNAIEGSTEITGGLVMTNLLMLKDTSTPAKVVAGMSGLPDNGDSITIGGEDYSSEGVTLWGGGTYEDALKQVCGLGSQLLHLLPIILTKTGVGSCIGCFHVDSANQVSITGADGVSKFIFNTGGVSSGAYMSILKNNIEVVRVTTDNIEPEKNIFMVKRFDYEPDDKFIVAEQDEDLTNKVVPLYTKSFASAMSYNLYRSHTSQLYMKCYIGYSGTGTASNISLSFDVYLADKKIKTIQGTGLSQGYILVHESVSIPESYSYSQEHSGNVALDIRNISITDADRPNQHPVLAIETFAFGDGTWNSSTQSYDNWVDGLIRLYTSNVTPKTIVGGNGVSVNGNNGTNYSLLNVNGVLRFHTYGLNDNNGSPGEVTDWFDDWRAFKAYLRSAQANWNSWTAPDRLAFWGNLVDSLPDSVHKLRLN